VGLPTAVFCGFINIVLPFALFKVGRAYQLALFETVLDPLGVKTGRLLGLSYLSEVFLVKILPFATALKAGYVTPL
jgi:hypothetical protein